jgi:hypothetical protein
MERPVYIIQSRTPDTLWIREPDSEPYPTREKAVEAVTHLEDQNDEGRCIAYRVVEAYL